MLDLAGAWHIAYYVSEQRGQSGTLPYYIIQFKNNNSGIVTKWCNWAIDELSAKNLNFDYIVRALGSRELTPSGTKALDKLGAALAGKYNCQYVPQVLAKTKVTPAMHTLKTREERAAAMKGVYYVKDKSNNLNGRNVLVLDDVTTSCTTLTEIMRALRVEWPRGNYYFFCLGRTEQDTEANIGISLDYFT